MRTRTRAVCLLALLTAVVMALPSITSARPPRHNHGLTINATPNPIDAGDPALIYGQLNTANNANRTVTLYHHLAGSGRGYSIVQQTKTTNTGFYSFTRKPGVILTNRSWFARVGKTGVHSRTVFERVHALVSVMNPPADALTNHPITITGSVTPNHRGERVFLQVQSGNDGDQWRTIDSARIHPGSNFAIRHNFRVAGDRTLRVVFRGDRRNLRGVSDSFSVAVSQVQNPAFTLNASADPTKVGDSVTLTGTLAAPNNANTNVTLYTRAWNAKGFASVATAKTDGSGNYSFTQSPQHNTVYEVRTSATTDKRQSRQLFEGVHDTVTVEASSTTPQVGQPVTFTGTVAPDKVGHVIELQKLGRDGHWQTIEAGRVKAGSTYALSFAFRAPGDKSVRVRIPGGPVNEGGVSDVVHITVGAATSSSPLAPAS